MDRCSYLIVCRKVTQSPSAIGIIGCLRAATFPAKANIALLAECYLLPGRRAVSWIVKDLDGNMLAQARGSVEVADDVKPVFLVDRLRFVIHKPGFLAVDLAIDGRIVARRELASDIKAGQVAARA